jgi:hypothetical protein
VLEAAGIEESAENVVETVAMYGTEALTVRTETDCKELSLWTMLEEAPPPEVDTVDEASTIEEAVEDEGRVVDIETDSETLEDMATDLADIDSLTAMVEAMLEDIEGATGMTENDTDTGEALADVLINTMNEEPVDMSGVEKTTGVEETVMDEKAIIDEETAGVDDAAIFVHLVVILSARLPPIAMCSK